MLKKKIPEIKSLAAPLSVLIALLLVYGIFLVPGPRGAGDFPFAFPDAAKFGFNLPFTWSTRGGDGLGVYSVSTLWTWPLDLSYGLGVKLGISSTILERVLGVLLPLLIGYFSIGRLLQSQGIKGWGKYIGTFFYLTNTYVLLLIDGGQLLIALAYALFPLCFWLVDRSIERNIKEKFLASLSFIALGFFDPRFIYILVVLLITRFVYVLVVDKRWLDYKWFYSWGWFCLLTFFLYSLLNAYWLIPLIFARTSFLPSMYTRAAEVATLSFTSLSHALLFQQPNWFKNVFGVVTPPLVGFVLIPILVFLAPVFKRQSKIVGFWLIVSIIGILLSKGSQEPLPQIYIFLFTKVPGFSLFRDSSKFFFFLGVSYTVLLSISVEEILKFNFSFNPLNRIMKILPVFILIYFIWLVRPTYLVQMTGLFSPQVFQSSYLKLASYLSSDKDYGLVAWIPDRPPLGFTSPAHPSIGLSYLSQKRPFQIGTNGAYEIFNFLREASYSGQLLDVAGVNYIAYPPLDPRRDDVKPDSVTYYYTFLNQLNSRFWVSPQREDFGIPLIKTRAHQNKVFVTKNLWWVIGSDSLYSELTKSGNLALSKNAIVFAEEYPGLSNRLNEYPQAKIVLNNKSLFDLAADFIPASNLIFPAKNLDFSPGKNGWWKREAADLISWKDFLESKYGIHNQDFDLGGGWAVAEGDKKLSINLANVHQGDVLLARVLESTQSGQIQFMQGDQVVGVLQTQKSGGDVRWFQVGNLVNMDSITIQTQGNINVVNVISIIDPKQWQDFRNRANGFNSKVVDFNDENATNLQNSPKLDFKEVNPTQYKIDIFGLSEPAFIVLSQNYNNLWWLNGQNSLPVYSLLNGFEVYKDGEYTINFEPQKYVYPGLIISTTSLLVLIGFLIFLKKNTPSIGD